MVSIGPRLQEHLKKKHLHLILVDVAFCKSCGGAVGEPFARPATQAEATDILARPSVRRLPCCLPDGEPLLVDGQPVELVVANPAIHIADQATLEAGALLGAANLKISGIRY